MKTELIYCLSKTKQNKKIQWLDIVCLLHLLMLRLRLSPACYVAWEATWIVSKDFLLSGFNLGFPTWNLQKIRRWVQKEANVLFLGVATKYAAPGSLCLSLESYQSCQAALSIQETSLVLVITWLPVQEQGGQLTSYFISLSLLVSLDFFITLLTV